MSHPKLATPGAAASLPVHPTTGLAALAVIGGKPVWPIAGGSQPVGGDPAPAPGAPPAAPPTPGPTPPALAVPPTPPGQDPNTPVDVSNLPANVQKLIADLRKENGTHRTGKTAAEDRLAAVLKAAGLNPDGTPVADPEKAAAELVRRAEQAESAAWANAAELQLYHAANKLGADTGRLLDSRSFLDTLEDLVEGEPGTGEFTTALEAKVQAWLTAHPEFKTAPVNPAATRSGGALPGGPGAQPERATSLGAAIRETLQAKAR